MIIVVKNGDVVGGVKQSLINQAIAMAHTKELLHYQLVRKGRATFDSVLSDPIITAAFGGDVIPLKSYNVNLSSYNPYNYDSFFDLGLNQLLNGQKPSHFYYGSDANSLNHDESNIKAKVVDLAQSSFKINFECDIIIAYSYPHPTYPTMTLTAEAVIASGISSTDSNGNDLYGTAIMEPSIFPVPYRAKLGSANAYGGVTTLSHTVTTTVTNLDGTTTTTTTTVIDGYSVRFTDPNNGASYYYTIPANATFTGSQARSNVSGIIIQHDSPAFAIYGAYVGEVGGHHIFANGFSVSRYHRFAFGSGAGDYNFFRNFSKFASDNILQIEVQMLCRMDTRRTPVMSNKLFVEHWQDFFELVVWDSTSFWKQALAGLIIFAAIIYTIYTFSSDGGLVLKLSWSLAGDLVAALAANGVSAALIADIVVAITYTAIAIDGALMLMEVASLVSNLSGMPSPSSTLAAKDDTVKNKVIMESNMVSPFDYDSYLNFDRLMSV